MNTNMGLLASEWNYLATVIEQIETEPPLNCPSPDRIRYDRSKELWRNRNVFLFRHVEITRNRAFDTNGHELKETERQAIIKLAVSLMRTDQRVA